ncbi:MAG TPA: hypothetical protein VE824_03160 [Gaiellales bacterium]|nr:hypothetical protein [Gaiellales bacterium]
MSTSTTLRLAGLVAAIAVSLSVTSSALAKPEGMIPSRSAVKGAVIVSGAQPSGPRTPAPASIISIRLHRSGQLVGPAPIVRADNPAEVGTPVVQSPMVRVDNPAQIGTPSVGLLPAAAAPAASSGFSWQDATLGALVGLALACLAGFAMGSLRGRRGLALRA